MVMLRGIFSEYIAAINSLTFVVAIKVEAKEYHGYHHPDKQCENRQNSFDGLGEVDTKLLYSRDHHIKDDIFQHDLFLSHQAREDADKGKTYAAKDKIFQAEHHEVDEQKQKQLDSSIYGKQGDHLLNKKLMG